MELQTIIGYAVSSILVILAIVLLIKSIHLKINTTLLFLTIIFTSVGNFLTIAFGIVELLLGSMLYCLGFIMLYFHYESIATRRPNLILTGFLVMTYAVALSFTFLLIIYLFDQNLIEIANANKFNYLLETDEIVYRIAYVIHGYSITFIGLLVFIRSFYIIFRAFLVTKSKPAFIDSIGLFCLIIYRAFFLPRYFISSTQFLFLTTLALIFSIIGLLLILVNYVINSDYLYLLPFPIYSFMIYNKSGVLCYSRKVKQSEPEMEEKDILISGAFTAISTLIQDTLGSNAKIKHINAQEYQIFFNALPNDAGTLIVIAYGETILFLQSLNRFLSTLSEDLLKSFNEASIITNFEQEVDILIQKSFPYVHFFKKE